MDRLLTYVLQFLIIALVMSFISKKDILSTEVLSVAVISTVCIAFIDKIYYPIDRFEAFDQTQKQALIDEFQQYINGYNAVKIDDKGLFNGYTYSSTYSQMLQDYLTFFKGTGLTKESIRNAYKNTLDQAIRSRLGYLYIYLGKLNVARTTCKNACSTLDCKNNCNNKEYELSSDVNDFYRLECKIICPSLECKNACDNKIYSTRTELGDIPINLSADKLNKELNRIVDLNKTSIDEVKTYFTDWTERMFQLMFPGENLISADQSLISIKNNFDKVLKHMYDYNKNKT